MIILKSTILFNCFVFLIFIKQLKYVLSEKETDPKFKELDSRIVSILDKQLTKKEEQIVLEHKYGIFKGPSHNPHQDKHDDFIRNSSHKNKNELAVALFDFEPVEVPVNPRLIYLTVTTYTQLLMRVKRGDQLIVVDDQVYQVDDLWHVKNIVSLEEGYIPNIIASILPSNTTLNTLALLNGAENVVGLVDFEANGLDNYIDFKKDDQLEVLKKSTDDTWVARNSATNLTGFVPSFMVAKPQDVLEKYAEDDRKIYTALKDFSAISLGLNNKGFLSYSRGDQLYIISGEFNDRVWYARSLTSQAEGYIARSDVIDQCDTVWLQGRGYINCGDKCVPRGTPCNDSRLILAFSRFFYIHKYSIVSIGVGIIGPTIGDCSLNLVPKIRVFQR